MEKEKEVRSIKVLSVSSNENVGGAAIAAHRIHKAVNAAQDGVVSTMFVKNRHTDDPTVRNVDEFVPRHLPYRVWQWGKTKCANKYWHALWGPYKNTNDTNYKSDLRGMDIGDALRKLDYDIVHLHWINQRFLKLEDIPDDKPIVWTLHDSWPFCGVCHYFLDCERYKKECGCCPQLGSDDVWDLSRKIWKAKQKCYADKDITVVCPSQWLADCAAESSLFKGRDIRVIPNCLDTEVFRPLSQSEVEANLFAALKQKVAVSRVLRAAGEKAEKPFILYGAANAAKDRIKGFSSLLSTLQILDKQRVEVNVVVFGAEKTELDLSFEYIHVDFVGYVGSVDFLVTLYNLADVMVVPSLTEVFGQTASESMACGTPVVAFRCTGVKDVVGEHGGYLAEPYSAVDLARGIKWILNRNRNGEMRDQVRNSALQRFGVSVVVKQYLALYREIIGKYQKDSALKSI